MLTDLLYTHTHIHTRTYIYIYMHDLYSVFTGTAMNRLWLLSKAFLVAKSYFLDGEQLVDIWNYRWVNKS